MKKTALLALVTAGAIMITAGCGNGKKIKSESSGDEVIKIGSMSATTADLNLITNAYMAQTDNFDSAKKSAVEDIERVYKYAEAAKADGIELGDDDRSSVLQMKANIRHAVASTTEEYNEYAAKAGIGDNFLETYATALIYSNKLSEKYYDEYNNAEVTDEEVGEYIKENYWRAKHILIAAPSEDEAAADTDVVTEEDGKTGKELAELILEKAKKGENFDDMIKKYNTDPGMESNADGYVFGAGQMVPEFEDCVKNLKVGEFGIAESSYGYHIIQKLSLDGSEDKFGEWVENNKDAVAQEIGNDKLEKKVEELCKKNNVKTEKNDSVIEKFTEKDFVKASNN